MKFAEVQQSIEEYIKDAWSLTELTFDNIAFNSDLYEEYTRCNILFGQGKQITITAGCYRQPGVFVLSSFVKPATGRARLLELANAAATLMTGVKIHSVAPLVAPVVNLKAPDLYINDVERSGWVMAQVSSEFYYDWSI